MPLISSLPPRASAKQSHQTLNIHFSSPVDNFNRSVWCSRWGYHEFHIHEPGDPLNRCPNYLLFAIVAALVDLGGVTEIEKTLPEYARGTFEQWRQLNGGSLPPRWKTALAVVGMIIYVFVFGIVLILFSPFYILFAGLRIWWKARKRVRYGS